MEGPESFLVNVEFYQVNDFRATLHLIRTSVDATNQKIDDDIRDDIERLLGRAQDQLDSYRNFLETLFTAVERDTDGLSLKARGKLREVSNAANFSTYFNR